MRLAFDTTDLSIGENARCVFAIVVANIARAIIIFFKIGSATSLPGLLALRIQPRLIKYLAVGQNVAVVSGTNGKTTTTRLLSSVLGEKGSVFGNWEGANLQSGIAAAMILSARKRLAWIVLEVDEAHCAYVVREAAPKVLVITSLTRDQLDRYGELDRVRGCLREAISNLPMDSVAVLNSDDPNVSAIAATTNVRPIWYSAIDGRGQVTLEADIDSTCCPVCRSALIYSSSYWCQRCGFAQPNPLVRCSRVDSFSPLRFRVNDVPYETPMRGKHNLRNAIAAVATAISVGIPTSLIGSRLGNVTEVAGRDTPAWLDGQAITIMLSKNPASFESNIDEILRRQHQAAIVIAVNDLAVDGSDVSWLWDVKFERLAKCDVIFAAAGMRYADVVLRLRYSNISCESGRSNVLKAVRDLARQVAGRRAVYLLCTYSVLLDLRAHGVLPSVA